MIVKRGHTMIVIIDPDDSVQIGDGSNQIPATLLVAADKVLRHCLENRTDLTVRFISENSDGQETWSAHVINEAHAHGSSPWEAVASLAAKLEGAR